MASTRSGRPEKWSRTTQMRPNLLPFPTTFGEESQEYVHHGHFAPNEIAPRAARTARARP